MARTSNSIPRGDWLAGVVLATAVTVGTIPTVLPAASLAHRRFITIVNNSAATIYLGGNDVQVGQGIPLVANASYSIDLDAATLIYAVEAAGNRNVRVLEAS